MMIGASFLRAASRHAFIPDDDTQFTAGIAYPNSIKANNEDEKLRGDGILDDDIAVTRLVSLTYLSLSHG
jgi:hypothetical protein